ncbi:unnamed protein product [Moneuplotes crassus]|uniref:Glycoside hydrolase family 38 central domain-containing protein n=1 Tax=Euplotes crassus TaxID=5936 RepID=A0AAD1XZM0_EUPCR|nr:unnamed protein product [Moneuplotes crassus]
MKPILVISLILCVAFAGITMDLDLEHGHSEDYFNNLESQKKNGKLYVHIVPHTHDDVGWLKTVEQYYLGAREDIQYAGVRYIISGIYNELMKDTTKKFTYVEMEFFQRWWEEQSEEVKKNVQTLVDEGRLQFVNAGMSMSDEATVHYEDFLNNMKAGHDFLKRELGYKPTIGWQIDPFGHHSATAALFAEMGFNAWFFARIDHKDKDRRLENKEMEWLYRPFSDTLGARAEIFTHMMYHHYSAPPGFNYNEFQDEHPIFDNPKYDNYNVDNKTGEFYKYILHMADHYKTNHLLVPFGDDFNFSNAAKMFFNIDKLIKNMNERYEDVELFYSTPNEYLEAIHEADIEWPTKYDDLFPYSDGDDAYWTGYFTSRANIKGYVREVSRDLLSQAPFLAVDNMLNTPESYNKFEDLFNQMGVLQHHDGVSGTEKQHVADDYVKNLHKVHTAAKNQFVEAFDRLFDTGLENLSMCLSHNSTYDHCPTKDLLNDDVEQIGLIVINSSNKRNSLAKIPLPNSRVTLLNNMGEEVPVDIICEADTSENCEAYFEVNATQFSWNIFFFKKTHESNHLRANSNLQTLNFGSLTMGVKNTNGDIELEFSKDGEKKQGVLMRYMYYNSYQDIEGQRSGAYIFRPSESDEEPQRYSSTYTYDGLQGNYVTQVRFYGSEVNNYVTGNIFTDFVEIKTDLFGIPLGFQGQEVILHLSFPEIQNGGVFYTDSMGMQMQERKLGYRPTWEFESTQPVSENYYPINHGMTLKDDKMTLEVLNERSQGGTCLQDGSMEFMIQRRTYKDDSRGVGEALNESRNSDKRGLRVITSHYLRFYNNTEDMEFNQDSRAMQREIDSPFTYVFGTVPENFTSQNSPFILGHEDLLPDSVKAVFLPQQDGTIFVRFENMMDPISLNKTETINVTEIGESIGEAIGVSLQQITEVSNTGLYTIEEMQDIKYKWKGVDYTTEEVIYSSDPSNTELGPQRIRSFVLSYAKQAEAISE